MLSHYSIKYNSAFFRFCPQVFRNPDQKLTFLFVQSMHFYRIISIFSAFFFLETNNAGKISHLFQSNPVNMIQLSDSQLEILRKQPLPQILHPPYLHSVSKPDSRKTHDKAFFVHIAFILPNPLGLFHPLL